MIQLLMIADDFTGALDTGVQFSSRGIRTKVVTRTGAFRLDRPQDLQDDTIEVLVYDAQSRHISERDAYEIVSLAVRAAVQAGIPYLYKKTDSALRGNVGAELTAMLDESPDPVLAFIPAFPKMQRITEGGIHYVDGTIPVGESLFAADPFNPVMHSTVSEIIHDQSGAETAVIGRGSYDGQLPLGIAIFDAQSQADLSEIAACLGRTAQTRTFAGCAGFASELPGLIGLIQKEMEIPAMPGRMTFVNGSLNPITQRQIAYAQERGFRRIMLSAEEKLLGEKAALFRDSSELFMKEKYVIIDANNQDAEDQAAAEQIIKERGLSVKAAGEQIASRMGQLMAELDELMDLGLIMITGGDTLFHCMQKLGVTEMEPVGELMPGVVLASFTHKGKQRYVITKSGGFGEETCLTEIRQRLEAQ